MTLVATAAAVGLWLVAGLAVYALAAYALLFYLSPGNRLTNGAVVDAIFITTVPFVLAVTWLAAVRD